MKNTGSKILILGVVIALAAAGVLVFYPTIVAPPTDVPVENLHKTSLDNDIIGFSEAESPAFNDSIYNIVINKLELYRMEKFLTEENLDYETKALVRKYLPIFSAQCYKRFQSSQWRESDHKAMLSRISNFRMLKVDYGKTDAVAGSYDQDLNNIEHIISQYNEAKLAAKHSSFYSVKDANEKIMMAESFKTADYLRNCTELVNDLSEVKVKIGDSHYNKVVTKVEEMRKYRYMSEEAFGVLVTSVSNLINEYNSNRLNYGNSAKSTDNLKSKANDYYKEARAYYESLIKPEISINSNQWTYMTSPNSFYRAYQSNSNYHISNSTSMMSFTIKGYESFTFYIRSNGEANYDYVMVGINRLPTIDSNYVSTKGIASSGTNFINYKTVHIANLNKKNSYTIYVVYKKDASGNIGTDRGYVLIPYEN